MGQKNRIHFTSKDTEKFSIEQNALYQQRLEFTKHTHIPHCRVVSRQQTDVFCGLRHVLTGECRL